MKLDQILVASGLGLLFFVGVFMSEKSRIDKISMIQNPFGKAQNIEGSLSLEVGAQPESILTKSGEFFVLQPGGVLDLTPGVRRLENGILFFSGSFTSENSQRMAQKNFAGPFESDLFVPQKNQMVVAGIGISAPGASILIVYEEDVLEIYTYSQAIELFLPGSSEPFLMPASHKIEVHKSLISPVLGSLYHTKLIKELRMEYVDKENFLYQSNDPVSSIFTSSLEAWEVQFQSIEDYAKNIPRTWARFSPDSFMGHILSGLSYLQKYFAYGYDINKQKNYNFELMQRDFIKAYFAYDQGNTRKSEKAIEQFSEMVSSIDWARFMIENPGYAQEWEVFSRSQRIWLRNILKDDDGQVFRSIWFGNPKVSSLEDFQYYFIDLEKLIFQQDYQQALLNIQSLKHSFEKIIFTPEDRSKITKLRRLFGTILKQENALQEGVSFELYAALVEEEIALLEDSLESDKVELSLENAQDLLWFLKKFLSQNYGEDISEILIEVYEFLGVDNIARTLDIESFTNEEREIIKLIRSSANGVLSESDLEELERQQALREGLGEIAEKEVIEEKEGIYTEEDLQDFLSREGISNPENMIFVSRKKASGATLNFSALSYKDESLSGTFQTDLQIFSQVTLEKEKDQNVGIYAFSSQLRKLAKKIENRREAEAYKEEEMAAIDPLDLLNISSLGSRQRRYVRDAFRSEGVTISLDDIRITSQDIDSFHIETSEFDGQYRLEFDYYYTKGVNDYITHVKVESGYNKFTFATQKFDRIGLNKALLKAIDTKFE